MSVAAIYSKHVCLQWQGIPRYPGSAGQGLTIKVLFTTAADNILIFFFVTVFCRENKALHFR